MRKDITRPGGKQVITRTVLYEDKHIHNVSIWLPYEGATHGTAMLFPDLVENKVRYGLCDHCNQWYVEGEAQ